jgi:hypothetical protein
VFLLANRTGIELVFFHNMTLDFFNKNMFQMQYDAVSSDEFLLVVLVNETKAHIYDLTLSKPSIQFFNNFRFMGVVEDIKVINQRAMVLHDDSLCFLQSDELKDKKFTTTCFALSDIIPK